MKQHPSLRDQLSRRLQFILGYYIAGTSLLIFVLALVGIGVSHRNQLTQYEALIFTKFSAELTAVLREADSVGSSSVVWTGLTDSSGREVYLEPLLDRINRDAQRQIDLLDYRGRDYIISKKSRQTPRLSPAAIQKTLDTVSVQAELHATPYGRVILFAIPITAPFADGLLGILLTQVNLDQQLKSLNLPSNLNIQYTLRKETDPLPKESWLTRVVEVPLQFDKLDVPLRVEVTQPLWNQMLLVLLAVLLLWICGYSLYRSVRIWVDHFSKLLTDRMDRLVQVTSQVAANGDVSVEKDLVGDEISAMFDAVQSIVVRQRATNQQLRVLARVFETAADAILITDKDGRIANVNSALLRITGYSRTDLIGQAAGLLYRGDTVAQSGLSIGDAMRQLGEWRGESHFMTRDHTPIPVMMSVSSLSDEHGHRLGNVAIASDIRAIKQVETRLRELIYQDPLTGLPNYLAFIEFIDQRLRGRDASHATPRFALLFIDLDYLKQVNDTFGHEQGDQVIAEFAHHLQATLPQPHFLCRRSGDEFIAVLDFEDSEEALRERFNSALPELTHQARLLPGSTWRGSFSVGAAIYPEHADNIKDLLVLADSALLYSKEAGRACITWLDAPIIRGIQRRHLLEVKLQEALRDQRLLPHYQPEVDMRTGQIIGFEALARWTDPDLGEISPAEFIPIAEEQGLIDPVTVVLLEKIVADMPKILTRFPQAKVAFNASPGLLSAQRIYKLLRAQPVESDSIYASLILEVTETDLMQSMTDAAQQLDAIIELGVHVAIDDFGAGYSSLSRLADLPIHKLKIDQSFIKALGNEDNAKVVGSIMALANTLHLEVTAEGVEHLFQRDMLLAIGCYKAQGFMFAKPMPLAQLLELPMTIRLADQANVS